MIRKIAIFERNLIVKVLKFYQGVFIRIRLMFPGYSKRELEMMRKRYISSSNNR